MRTINNILNGETSYYSCYDEYEQVESDYIYSEYKQFISKDKLLMAFKCSNSYDLIDKSTYYNDLQKYDISSHDFRFTSARDKFEDMLKNGISEKEAKV
jgi:hypothetical protein